MSSPRTKLSRVAGAGGCPDVRAQREVLSLNPPIAGEYRRRGSSQRAAAEHPKGDPLGARPMAYGDVPSGVETTAKSVDSG
jgi:hypothetical protein